MKHLLEPHSGIVQTEDEWRATWRRTDPELWGGPEFEDLELVEVHLNDAGQWE